jgi:hypothetical protein
MNFPRHSSRSKRSQNKPMKNIPIPCVRPSWASIGLSALCAAALSTSAFGFVLPDARQAHLLLTFGPRRMTTGDRPHPEWPATAANTTAYDSWAKRVVTRNLALGGYRLAALLKRIWP